MACLKCCERVLVLMVPDCASASAGSAHPSYSPCVDSSSALMLWASRRGQGDEFMDPTGTGSKVIPFWRSGFARSDDSKGTREALNLITHFLDASMVGSG